MSFKKCRSRQECRSNTGMSQKTLGFNESGFNKPWLQIAETLNTRKRASRIFLGTALSVSLGLGVALTPTGSANAAMINLGSVEVQVDTTVSVGVTYLMSERDEQFLPISNGGPAENKIYAAPTAADNPATPDVNEGAASLDYVQCAPGADLVYGGFCQDLPHTSTGTRPNFDGSINTDDGRLNFDEGDIVSAPFKITSEAEAFFGNLTAFGRFNAFYDAALMDDTNFIRGGLDDKGTTNAGRNIELLDLYVDYDGEVGSMPFTIRAGRQVINWGEATFVPGGNSAFSPIDVAAIRRPGSEIKEALLPVEALYGSIALSQDVTIEAYVGGWEEFKLDAGGTVFGGSDVFTPGVRGGNPHNVYFIGGGKRSGQQFACDTDALIQAVGMGDTLKIAEAVMKSGAIDCGANPNMDVLRTWTVGNAEQERWASGDTNVVRGLANDDGDQSAGLAIRWYAENLNSTEFALYYQKVDSRLPYISYRTGQSGITASSVSPLASTVGRGAGITGCLGLLSGNNGALPGLIGKLYNPAYVDVKVTDAHKLLHGSSSADEIQKVADDAAEAQAMGAFLKIQGELLTAGTTDNSLPADPANDTPTQAAARQVLTDTTAYQRNPDLPKDSVAYLQETNCLTYLAQGQPGISLGSAFDPGGQLPTGATNLQFDYDIGLFAEYPEVEIIGLSFNTTMFGWGVQGDFTYRPEMPLQLDTDTLTIAALFNNCAFATVGILEGLYQSGATYANENIEGSPIGCTDQDRYLKGYTTDYDASTWDIGTTATFTRSNPVISFFGADLGVLLTEFQGVIVEDIEEERGNTGGITALGQAKGITPLSNVCQGGSDLPLNGILAIDDRTIDNPKGFCRPTDSSWGAVLFAQLQYNNVFGTPIGLRPTFVYSEGIEGYSPSPLGFWREGVGVAALRVDATYLDAWQFGVTYTTYQGDKERTRNLDRDTMSLSMSYAF